MKINHHIFPVFIVCLILASCQKFVDIKKSGSQSFIETAQDCQLILDNYDLFNTAYPIDGEISTDDYYLDDAGYNSDPITLDDRSLYTWRSNAIRNEGTQWVNSYNKIYHTNLVLEALEKLNGKENTGILNNLKGSALFLRAYALWNLAQLYARPYGANAAQDPGIPVHLLSDINDIQGRGTVKNTYDRIVQDLSDAANLLNATSSISTRPNKAAAFAMLARVYLSMENYPAALASASSALALKHDLIDFNTLNRESFNPFVKFNKEVIFHSVVFSQNSVLEAGYGDQDLALINPEIISSYEINDLRKIILFKENTDVPVPSGTYRFTGNYESAVGSSKLFNGLAVDEVYLTRAESYARTGNADAAMQDLNTLLQSRWASGTYRTKTAGSVNDALSQVLGERRKELVMRGSRWTDLRRLNKEAQFARTLSRVVNGSTYTLPPNDNRYTLLIPQEVLTNSALAQNAR
jgi:tetratricopeptide (TPR) repeat protein